MKIIYIFFSPVLNILYNLTSTLSFTSKVKLQISYLRYLRYPTIRFKYIQFPSNMLVLFFSFYQCTCFERDTLLYLPCTTKFQQLILVVLFSNFVGFSHLFLIYFIETVTIEEETQIRLADFIRLKGQLQKMTTRKRKWKCTIAKRLLFFFLKKKELRNKQRVIVYQSLQICHRQQC